MGRAARLFIFVIVGVLSFFTYFISWAHCENAEEYVQQGISFYKEGDYEKAISNYTKAIELNPGQAEAYLNRGLAYAVKNNYDMAISDFSQTIKINPKLAQAYNNRAIVYFYKGEYDKAWEDVHKAEELGYKTQAKFIEQLKAESGREK